MGEADKLLTILTADLGRITVRCRGVRTLKSRRFAAAQMYMYSDMLLSEKDGQYALEEADTIESFFGIRNRLEAIACTDYFADLLYTVTVEGEGDREIMSLFLNCLYALANREELSVLLIKAVFEARLIALLGVMPDLSSCAECSAESVAWLDVAGGASLCRDCALSSTQALDERERLLLPLSEDVAALFRYVTSCEKRRIFAFQADPEVIEDFSRLTERYLLYHIEKKLDTLTFLHSVL